MQIYQETRLVCLLIFLLDGLNSIQINFKERREWVGSRNKFLLS